MESRENGYVIWRETEHQELWYPQADLTKPVRVHIPSALGPIGYYVCVRVPRGWADELGDVRFKADIGGLYHDVLDLAEGENMEVPNQFPSTDGYIWRLLCRAFMSRGDGIVEFDNWPAGLARTDLLLCTWPRYMVSGEADQWLESQADPLYTPTGIPLGGIGCGKVDFCRDGRFRNFSANNNQDMPFEQPKGIDGACLAVEHESERISLTSIPVKGAAPCKNLEFDGRFPQATLRSTGCFGGLDISVTGSGMFAPHDLKTSSLPAMLLRWRIKNNGAEQQTIRCSFNWPNLIGYGGGIAQTETDIGKGDGIYCYWEELDGRSEATFETELYKAVKFTGKENPQRLNSSGTHLLAVKNGPGATGASAADREGSVWQDVTIAPGEETTVDMALVWAMPHWIDTNGDDRGHLWLNYFSDAEEVAAEVLANADGILEKSGSISGLLAKTDLPDWLKQRLANCNYPLVTNSVLYKDGRFSINEGPTEMVGCYGTIDQRLGAHPTTQIFFPSLNETELTEFADYQAKNGDINHDLGHGHLESGPTGQRWPDIQCSFVIQTARHAWSTNDTEFEKAMWPKARKALLRAAIWAEEGGGVAQTGHKTGLGTSYDGYHYEGTTPYLGTLWLAALDVAEKWAGRMGDTELPPKIAEWRTAALQRMEKDLWNGNFYITYNSVNGPKRETCFAGMLAGQYFDRMLTGKDVLPPDRLLSSADAIMRLNGSMKYNVPPDEVTPDGDLMVMYGWLPYVEAFGLTAAASVRDHRVLGVWERMMKSVAADGERLCDTRLMYQPVSGEISWGSYYMTAPASWLVYNALLDFFYAPETGTLRLNPQFGGKIAIFHPLWWGIADVSEDEVAVEVEKVFTDRPLHVTTIEVLESVTDGAKYRNVELPEPVVLDQGSVYKWKRK